MINWKKLDRIEQLEEIDHLSESHPVVIFKHSTRCSISAATLNRLERKWDNKKVENLIPYFLDIIANRDISNAIAHRYQIEHESPQALVLKEGKCVYSNSHFDITFDDISDTVDSISA